MQKHYEKIICACCFLIYFLNVGFPSTSFNVYQPYLADLSYVGNTGASVIVGIRAGVSFFAMFFTALFYKKLDCRIGVFVASLFTSAGFILYGLASSFAGFCLAAIFAGIGYGLGGVVAVTMIINRWVTKNVGAAVGFATLGSGVSSIILPPIIARIIDSSSLSNAFIFEASIAVVTSLILVIFLKNNPKENSQPVTDCADDTDDTQDSKAGEVTNNDANQQKEGIPAKQFKLMVFAMALVGCTAIGATNYFSILLTSEGIDLINAATLVSLLGASLSVSKFVGGIIFDKLGSTKASIILFAFMIIGLVFCCLSACFTSHAIAVLAAICTGAGACIGSIGLSLWSIEISPTERFAESVKNLQTSYAFGGFVFMFIPGILKDLCGSYIISYVLLLVITIVSACIVIPTLIRKHNRAN